MSVVDVLLSFFFVQSFITGTKKLTGFSTKTVQRTAESYRCSKTSLAFYHDINLYMYHHASARCNHLEGVWSTAIIKYGFHFSFERVHVLFSAWCAQLTPFIATAADGALTASSTRPTVAAVISPADSQLFGVNVPLVHSGGWRAAYGVGTDEYIQVRFHSSGERRHMLATNTTT